MNKNKTLNDFLPNKNSTYLKKFNISHIKEIKPILETQVIDCIKKVMDPEIPVNLYDLGLIYKINVSKNNVYIEMTLTNPNCPVAGQMPENVGKSLEVLEDLNSVEVKIVWEPKWDKDLMSEDAKLALDIF